MCRLTQLVERRPRRRPTSTLDPSAVAQPSRRTDRGHHVAAQAGSRAARRGGAQPERHAEEGARWRSCPRATPRVTRLCVPADSLQSARRAPAHTPAAPPVGCCRGCGGRQGMLHACASAEGCAFARHTGRALSPDAPGRSLQVLTGVPPAEVLKDMGAQLAAEGVGAELPARLFLRRAPLQGRHRRMSHQRGWQKARGRGPSPGDGSTGSGGSKSRASGWALRCSS